MCKVSEIYILTINTSSFQSFLIMIIKVRKKKYIQLYMYNLCIANYEFKLFSNIIVSILRINYVYINVENAEYIKHYTSYHVISYKCINIQNLSSYIFNFYVYLYTYFIYNSISSVHKQIIPFWIALILDV